MHRTFDFQSWCRDSPMAPRACQSLFTLPPVLRRRRRGTFRAAARHGDLVGVFGVTLAAVVMPVVPSAFHNAESARLVKCVGCSVRAIGAMGQRPGPPFCFEVFAEPRVGGWLIFEGAEAAREL